jgi:hypothetical protein
VPPNRPSMITPKSQRWRYGLASAPGQERRFGAYATMSAIAPKGDLDTASQCAAEELNRRGLAGGKWFAAQVIRVRKRLSA